MPLSTAFAKFFAASTTAEDAEFYVVRHRTMREDGTPGKKLVSTNFQTLDAARAYFAKKDQAARLFAVYVSSVGSEHFVELSPC